MPSQLWPAISSTLQLSTAGWGLRDRAMLLGAYDAALPGSELVAVEVEHVEGPARAGSGLLFISKSKTHQRGEGAARLLVAQDDGGSCRLAGVGQGQQRSPVPLHPLPPGRQARSS